MGSPEPVSPHVGVRPCRPSFYVLLSFCYVLGVFTLGGGVYITAPPVIFDVGLGGEKLSRCSFMFIARVVQCGTCCVCGIWETPPL